MRTEHVVVNRYDPRWSGQFAAIQGEIEAALGDLAVRVEHVGSTSVEGLAAKPVIDIDVVIEDRSKLADAIKALSAIGYTHEGDLGIEGREAFKYSGPGPARHLYVCAKDSSELARHTAFRDYLRRHPEAAAEYAAVKEKGARLYPYNVDKYIEYKSPFIERIYALIESEGREKEAAQADEPRGEETEKENENDA